MEEKRVYLDDGNRKIAFEIDSSFSLDETDYCWLREEGSEALSLFRFYPDGEDMIFEAVDDQEEFKEARMAYLELIGEQKDQYESE